MQLFADFSLWGVRVGAWNVTRPTKDDGSVYCLLSAVVVLYSLAVTSFAAVW